MWGRLQVHVVTSDGRLGWPELAEKLEKSTGEERAAVWKEAVASAVEDQECFWDWFETLGPDQRGLRSLAFGVVLHWSPRSKRVPPGMPVRLLKPLVGAGVEERNPSNNRVFVEPAVRSFGWTPVVEELLSYFDEGHDELKAGAARALYWANALGAVDSTELASAWIARCCESLLRPRTWGFSGGSSVK